MELAFTNLLIIVAAGFAAPLALGFFPSIRLPAVVLEIVIGIAIGPAVLGWVHVDDPVQVFATVGLAYLLFLAGLEIDFARLRGRVLRLALVGFVVSLAIAIVVGVALKAGGFVEQPLFVAIVLSATSLGALVPVLKDAGESDSTFGQLIIAAARSPTSRRSSCSRSSSRASRARRRRRSSCSAACSWWPCWSRS